MCKRIDERLDFFIDLDLRYVVVQYCLTEININTRIYELSTTYYYI